MNIIKQIIDENGNNIYPIGYAQGGMKMDLLWTNPSPTSAFSAQTVSLDLSGYSYVYIECLMASSYTSQYINAHLFRVGGGLSYRMIGGGSTIMFRDATPTTSGVEFSVGYIVNTYTSNVTDNTRIIPLHIYGIKLSYIVPTSVHGLQYVEV